MAGGSSDADITMRYFDGCPGWSLAEARLREAIAMVGGANAVVVLEVISTHDESGAARFQRVSVDAA